MIYMGRDGETPEALKVNYASKREYNNNSGRGRRLQIMKPAAIKRNYLSKTRKRNHYDY